MVQMEIILLEEFGGICSKEISVLFMFKEAVFTEPETAFFFHRRL